MGPHPPRLDPVRLHDLTDGPLPDGDDDIVEARRIRDVTADELVLDGLTFTECELASWRVQHLTMATTRLMDVSIRGWGVPVVAAGRLSVRNLEVHESRLGAVDLHDARVRRLLVKGAKLTWVNLRAAELTDVRFEECAFDEIDLSDATATRVAFHDCTTATVSLHNSKLTDVDLQGLEMRTINGLGGLRGATISQAQLSELAPLLAAHQGIVVD